MYSDFDALLYKTTLRNKLHIFQKHDIEKKIEIEEEILAIIIIKDL